MKANLIKSKFEFAWCTGFDLSTAQGLRPYNRVDDLELRLCYISTQTNRVYLIHCNKGYVYVPFTYTGGGWRKLYDHLVKVKDFEPSDLDTEYALKAKMEYNLILQFRSSAEGYYDEHPKASDIISRVKDGMTVNDLHNMRYTVYDASVQEDKEWDGAVKVLCDNGWLLYPYLESEDGEKYLITEYVTKAPDSVVQSALEEIGSAYGQLETMLRSIHFSTIRRLIDKIGG